MPGRKGMKWGYNIYSKIEDYIPHGKKAVGDATNYLDNHINSSISSKSVSDKVYNTLSNRLDKVYKPKTATLDDDYFTFMKRDIQGRLRDRMNSKIRDFSDRTGNLVTSPYLEKERRIAAVGGKDALAQYLTKSMNDPEAQRRYAKAAADFAIPTYKGRKATLDDNFTTFMKNDLKDRANDLKNSIKNKLTSKENVARTAGLVKAGAKKVAGILLDNYNDPDTSRLTKKLKDYSIRKTRKFIGI